MHVLLRLDGAYEVNHDLRNHATVKLGQHVPAAS
jgi:hypothetical protein